LREFFISTALVVAAMNASAESPSAIEILKQKTLARIEKLNDSIDGVLGVYAIDLATGQIISFHSDTAFAVASTIKIPILIQMFKAARAGQFKMTDSITLQPSETVGGSGHLQTLLRSGPVTLTVKELITAMIETSDNTATNKCISMVGIDNVNRTLDELGMRATRLQRKMLDSAASKADRENISTPSEMAHLAELIYRGKAVDADASSEMIKILKLVDSDIRKVIPDNIEVASKPGELTGVRCETAIVFMKKHPFVVTVNSTFIKPGTDPVPDAARIIFEYFEKLEASNSYGNKIQ
jgi:beta-lactamase class A